MNDDYRLPFGKRILRTIGLLLLLLIIAAAVLIGFLTVAEFNPADEETLIVKGEATHSIRITDELNVLSWNLGYGGLGEDADFFMDGGTSVVTGDETGVKMNMTRMISQMQELYPDIILLQEVDQNSKRSFYVDETDMMAKAFPNTETTFAQNYKVAFVPYPIPPIGKVNSGIMTLSSYPVQSATRVQLPCPFKWPVRVANLKRCLSIHRIPVNGTERELVVINLHLEAFDSGEGKIAQTKALAELMNKELEKDNYIIVGGDFNQIFSTEDASLFPHQEGKWTMGELDESIFDDSFVFLMDETTPSCRSLDQAYVGANKETFQYYLVDGFIVSNNLTVLNCETKDFGFVNSDHNPVLLRVRLK